MGVFYRWDAAGGPIPDGPVLVVANHPNSLLDPLLLFRTAGRPTRPLAKAPLFDHPLLGPILRALGGLPVYRRQDDPSLTERNEETFRAAVEALRRREAVQLYPEGRSHSEPALAPLRTGAARIALRAEDEAGWELGLRIVPAGITYERKAFFRGRAAVSIGEPFGISERRDAYRADPQAAVRDLTREIAERIEGVTLNLARHEDRDLIETAARLYAREKNWVGWRERAELGEELPLLQRFAEGLGWLRAHDPKRHRRLAASVRGYRRILRRLGSGSADVPPSYPGGIVLRYAARETLILALGLPLAALGVFLWYPPYAIPRLLLRRFPPDPESVATWKLGLALLLMPMTYVGWLAVAAWIGGAAGVAVAAPALPAAGLLALHWKERGDQVFEDARLYLRVLWRPWLMEELSKRRIRLVGEFEAVQRDMEASRAGDPTLPAENS